VFDRFQPDGFPVQVVQARRYFSNRLQAVCKLLKQDQCITSAIFSVHLECSKQTLNMAEFKITIYEIAPQIHSS
jgi:hypothetical protein